MDVRLVGWRASNLRGGLRDFALDLGVTPPRWTLIQMENGQGKTTTMDLLRKTLAGEELTPNQVRELRADDEVETGFFEASIDVDGKLYRLQLELDFRTGGYSYWTVQERERSGGLEEGRSLPVDLRMLLTPQLTELFVFNGELASRIIDLNRTAASQAVRSLYGLDIVDGVAIRIDNLKQQELRHAAAVTAAKERKGISQLENALSDAQEAHERLTELHRSTTSRIATLEGECTKLREDIQNRMSEDADIRAQIEALNEQQRETDDNVVDLSARALEALRRPAFVRPRLLERLQNLGGRLYELKLPETISKEFFNELAQQELCVCGRPIGDHERHEIVSGASRYLAQDQISVINQMKLALHESRADPDELGAAITSLQEQLVTRRKIAGERDRITSERMSDGDVVLRALNEQLVTRSQEMATLSSSLERLTTKDPGRQRALRLSWEANLPLCEAELKNRELRLQTATQTRRFARQADALKAMIAATSNRALTTLRERVRTKTNEKLENIFQNEKIEIAKIDGGLVLRTDGLGVKSGASEGQKLAISYAFLTSLLADAPYRLPFIVDSPAVSLDVSNRRQIGEIIPEFFNQMVMFVISTERPGFAESFYGRADARFLTVVPATKGRVQIVDGLDTFRSFQDTR